MAPAITGCDDPRLAWVRCPQTASPENFATAVRQGLMSRPRTLPCRYFYDARGSELFERICELPEYYLTRAEDAILSGHALDMLAGWDHPPTLVELGSGSSIKTRRLLEAGVDTYGSLHYIPIDVSAAILEESVPPLVAAYPALRVTGYVADYRTALESICRTVTGPKLVVFLGSSLGNYDAVESRRFLRGIARQLGPRDRFLLGTDLDKDPARLIAAYDDAAGVTAAFNKNLLERINQELGGNFHLDRFRHEARYDPGKQRIEMHLVSEIPQVVDIPGSGVTVLFGEGESIHTESSHKYTPAGLAELAAASGFEEEAAWTDDEGLFRVERWRPRTAT
jgi:dimethylhistidine N-methyltransferase